MLILIYIDLQILVEWYFAVPYDCFPYFLRIFHSHRSDHGKEYFSAGEKWPLENHLPSLLRQAVLESLSSSTYLRDDEQNSNAVRKDKYKLDK